MVEEAIRLIRPGLKQPKRGRLAFFLVLVMLIPLFQPVQADITVRQDDFDLLETLSDVMALQESSDDSVVAVGSSTSALALVEAAKRESQAGDPLDDATQYLNNVELRDTTPLAEDHPRPYEILLDTNSQPDGWPNNLLQTLFSLEAISLTDPLAVGINTYALYVNFSSRNSGPQFETWSYGTFTGELFVGADLVLFENYIDIDGDGDKEESMKDAAKDKKVVTKPASNPVKAAIGNKKAVTPFFPSYELCRDVFSLLRWTPWPPRRATPCRPASPPP